MTVKENDETIYSKITRGLSHFLFLWIDPFFGLNEEHFTSNLQYKHSGTIATICLKTKLKWRFFSSRTLRIHDTSNDMIRLHQRRLLAVVQSHPPSPPPSATPTHLPREKKMRLPERECCTSIEAWEDGDKRYPGNEVDLEHNDYDVMCLDKMQHEKLLFYISLSFCFWVRSRFCFVFLVWGFVFPFRDLSFCFGFWVFDFACMLFF